MSAVTERRLVLNVDDDDLSRYAISEILRRGGYRVVEAITAADALAIVGSQRPALVVLDINLPDGSGIEVCRQIKADPATWLTPVLQVSASRVAIEDQVAGLDGGADGYLTWPSDPFVLLATARALVRARDAEAEAATLGREWQATVDATRDAILVLDVAGRIVRVNRRAAGVLGIDAADLVGLDLPTLLDPGDVAGVRDRVAGAVEGVRAAPFEVSVGSTWQAVTVDAIRGDAGRAQGAVLVMTDVTDRRAVDALRDTFIGILSHELRTPVTTILGGSRVLESRQDLPAPVRAELMADINAEAERLHHLVEDLLVLARTERGVPMSMADPILLQHVITKVVETERRRWPGVRITVDAGRLATASGDAGYVEQVLRNLISNAAKYGAGGDIAVTAGESPDGIQVTVRDHGPGIAPGDAERLFELFYRSPAAKREASGAGIGLFVCRELVRAMGGEIWLARPDTGPGSEFRFTLPMFTELVPAAPR